MALHPAINLQPVTQILLLTPGDVGLFIALQVAEAFLQDALLQIMKNK